MSTQRTREKKRQEPDHAPALRLEYRTAAELEDNPRNWRTHPDAQLGALSGVIAEVGWAGAVLYNERTKRLIDGHARKAISKPDEKIPVLVGDWSEEQEMKILATLDPIGTMAVADQAALDSLLSQLTTDNPAIDEMLKSMKAPEPEQKESPESFPSYDEQIETNFCCPKCGYKWAGPTRGGRSAESDLPGGEDDDGGETDEPEPEDE